MNEHLKRIICSSIAGPLLVTVGMAAGMPAQDIVWTASSGSLPSDPSIPSSQRFELIGDPTLVVVSGSSMRVVDPSDPASILFRKDLSNSPLALTTSWEFETTVQMLSDNRAAGHLDWGMVVGVHLNGRAVDLAIDESQVGFTDGPSGVWLGSVMMDAASEYHHYRVASQDGTVRLFIDHSASPCLSLPITSFSGSSASAIVLARTSTAGVSRFQQRSFIFSSARPFGATAEPPSATGPVPLKPTQRPPTIFNLVEWISPTSGLWDDVDNWSTGQLPGPNSYVRIDVHGTAITVELSGAATISYLECHENLSLSGGTLELTSRGTVSGTLAMSFGRVKATGAGASFEAVGPASAVNSAVEATGGGEVVLPTLTTWTAPGFSGPMMIADGAGSLVSFPALVLISAPTGGSVWSYVQMIQGLNEGVVDLPSLLSIDGGFGNDHLEMRADSGGRVSAPSLLGVASGSVFVMSFGVGSVVDVPSLVSFGNGSDDGRLFASSGGTIVTDSLTHLNGVNVQWDGTGNFSMEQFQVFNNGTLDIDAPAGPLDALVDIRGSMIDADGVLVTLPNLLFFEAMACQALNGAVIDLPTVNGYDASFRGIGILFLADGAGSLVSLPGMTSLESGLSAWPWPNGHDVVARNGGVVSAPNLATVIGGFHSFNKFRFMAESGGVIEMPGLVDTSLGYIGLISTGTGSSIDVSTLVSHGDPGHLGNEFRASGGGMIVNPAMTHVVGSYLTWDGTGALSTAQMQAFTKGTMDLSGSAPDLSGMTDLSGTHLTVATVSPDYSSVTTFDSGRITATGSAQVVLPSVVNYDLSTSQGTVLSASGVGTTVAMPGCTTIGSSGTGGAAVIEASGILAKIDLGGVTAVTGMSSGGWLRFEASGGAVVDLSSHSDVVSGNVEYKADGFGSTVDASPLVNYPAGTLFTETNGGVVLHQ